MSATPTAPDSRPLRADAERNRQLLLEAAGQLFSERGLDVPLEEIARRAGVGVATAYRRFGDRKALIDQLLESRVDELVAIAEESVRIEDPEEAFRTFVLRTARATTVDRGLRAIAYSGDGERQQRVNERLAPVAGEVLGRAQAAGFLRDDITANDLPLMGIMLGALGDATRTVRPDMWSRWLTLILDGMMVSRTAPTPLEEPPLSDDEFQRTLAEGDF